MRRRALCIALLLIAALPAAGDAQKFAFTEVAVADSVAQQFDKIQLREPLCLYGEVRGDTLVITRQHASATSCAPNAIGIASRSSRCLISAESNHVFEKSGALIWIRMCGNGQWNALIRFPALPPPRVVPRGTRA